MAWPKYKSDPIREAVCEIHFVPSEPWDITIVGRVKERLADEYPTPPQQVRSIEATQSGKKTVEFKDALARFQFKGREQNALLGLGPDVVTIHALRPYPGWNESFKSRIERVVQCYSEVSKPKGVRRVGLRYINEIDVPSDSINLRDYFTTGASWPGGARQRLDAFASRVQISVPDSPILLLVTFASGLADNVSTSTFVLDVDAVANFPEEAPIGLDELWEWLGRLRVAERETFEAFLTDKARELFGMDTNGKR